MFALSRPSEVAAAPGKGRRWDQEVRGSIRERLLRGEIGATTAAHATRDLLRMPAMLRRAGVAEPPYAASCYRAEHVLAYRESPLWRLTTKRPVLSTLRTLLASKGSELASRSALWRIPRGRPTRRYWITRDQMAELYDASRGRERVHLAFQGFNGGRECELLRLGWTDVDFTSGTMAIVGKGRNGGKPRTIPMTPTTRAVLEEWRARSMGRLVYGVAHAAAHAELAGLGKRVGVGVPLSGHVLRRSFGRIAYQAGVPLVDIRNIYGHESVEMTAYYIGVDEEAMAAGLARFDQFVRGTGAI